MPNVLIIEDDEVLALGLKKAFAAEGYTPLNAYDGDTGLYMARTESPDIIILDVMMPNMNGFEVTTELRRTGEQVPIIILSARSDKADLIRGLDLGADDYLTKPFDLDELMARVRRKLGQQQEKKTELGGFSYDWKLRQLIQIDGPAPNTTIELAQKEQLLLEFFLRRPGQIVSREQILDGVWGADYDGTDRTVDNFVMILRKKTSARHFKTVRGLGYRFEK